MSAKFFYYPQPTGNQLITIDLGEDLAELYSDWEYTSSSGQTMNGRISTTTQLNREVITIVRDRFQGGEDLAHKFAALQNHLDRGYSVAFTADHTKSFCFPLKVNPFGGDTTLQCFNNPFYNLIGYGINPSVNDYVALETQPPGALYEMCKISAVDANFGSTVGGSLTVDRAINFTYNSSVWMRWYRFWPMLKRLEADRGKNIITNEHGIAWSLEIRLTPDYSNLYAFHPTIDSDYSPSGVSSYVIDGPGIVGNPGEVFGGASSSVTLDSPPNLGLDLEDTFETVQNKPWNHWTNWGN
tara:strand:+ start:1602 stop:2495 length:894 start_codon:yes stop_codon:yes gene_type:complete